MLQLIYPRGKSESTPPSLQCGGTAGETISLRFELTSDLPIVELRLSAGAVNSEQPVVSELEFDLFVVKKWQAAGIGIYQSAAVMVEELLLKDDRIELTDSYHAAIKSWREILKPSRVYRAPTIPTHTDVRTSLNAAEAKSFFARIKIPKQLAPGNYSSEIVCRSNSNTLLTIPLNVRVAPIKLLQPPQTFFIWYKGRLDQHCPQHYVTEQIFRLHLQDIHDHGFNSISLSDVDTDCAQKTIEIAEEIGFQNILLTPPFPELTKLRFRKSHPIVYLSDELDMHIEFPGSEKPENLIRYHQLNYKRAQTVDSATTMVSLLNHTFIKRFQNDADIGHCPKIISLYLNRNREFFQFIDQMKNSISSQVFYFWQCHMEKPNLNRVLAGAYLWKSGAAGISPYCYQHMPTYPNSPFNDFDEWEPEFHENGITRPFKDHMTTYPARNGVIPTLQWEALREGITDFKYWSTVYDLIGKGMTSDNKEVVQLASEAKERCDTTLSRINLTTISINSETEPEPYDSIESHEYDNFRNHLRSEIEELTKVLGLEF